MPGSPARSCTGWCWSGTGPRPYPARRCPGPPGPAGRCSWARCCWACSRWAGCHGCGRCWWRCSSGC
ncbi:hypothetical protein AD006_13620 [Pseudonocardia sp. EC080610-09]|nr:hypothetical protein FRP1_05995 [Pseudonocardia sp. EC080625-04]ALL76085.1 hypothetical protein AD006_13620 [Pseudonocardia sp. EC080610-09]